MIIAKGRMRVFCILGQGNGITAVDAGLERVWRDEEKILEDLARDLLLYQGKKKQKGD